MWALKITALFLVGYLISLGYAPYHHSTVAWVGLTACLYAFHHCSSFPQAFLAGSVVGLGWYAPAMMWLYDGVNRSGDATLAVLAPSMLIAGLIILPLLLALVTHWSKRLPLGAGLLLIPTVVFLIEWCKHMGPIPFPWLTLGYTQVPSGLAVALLPWVGVLGVSWLLPFSSVLLLESFRRRSVRTAFVVASVLTVTVVAAGLQKFTTTEGKSLQVALVQGNVVVAGGAVPTKAITIMEEYLEKIQAIQAQLIVLPETSWPIFHHQIPAGVLPAIIAHLSVKGQDLISGYLKRDANPDLGYYNVAHAMGVSGDQLYFKRKLVPFGEYIPFEVYLKALYERVSKMTLLETSPGTAEQALPMVAGYRIAIRLCYEDLFSFWQQSELAHAHFIVAMANDDWFDSEVPLQQHLQISQARAIEAGKQILRVGNTGGTSLIDHDGQIIRALPRGKPDVLMVNVTPREGATPFSRFGLLSSMAMILLMSGLTLLLWPRHRK
jgi:apolipoprotein N-acyltransferase